MKQTLSLLLFVLLISFAFGQTATPPSGTGTSGDPYQIATLENLYWYCINYSGYAIQTQDINAAATSTWNEGAGWPTIGSGNQYLDTYDGQNHTIDSLYINRPLTQYIGFIGQGVGATVKNLGLTNLNITGGEKTASIFGIGSALTVENCYVTGSVTGTNDVGGIIAFVNNNDAGYIQECYSSASVSGSSDVGGILGDGRCNIINCYANGSSSASYYAGGLVGYAWQSMIINCYSSAVVVNGGGLVGHSDAGGEGGSTALNSYWDTNVSGQVESALGTAYSTEIMKIQAAYNGWDFVTVWTMDNTYNDGYPYLQAMVPTETALPITLAKFEALLDNGVVNLTWNTESETDNARFLIYRDGEIIASIDGAGTSSKPHDYSYIDTDVMPGKSYTYVLADVSLANELTVHNDHALTITIDEQVISSEGFKLRSNYPNPFNPTTTIPFDVLNEDHINLSIYDVKGTLVRQLIDDEYASGNYTVTWDGKNQDGKDLESGLYLYLMTSSNLTQSGKMLLVK